MILTEMKDPRLRLASISRVRCSPDLREAWLSVSALGDDAERQNVVETLTRPRVSCAASSVAGSRTCGVSPDSTSSLTNRSPTA